MTSCGMSASQTWSAERRLLLMSAENTKLHVPTFTAGHGTDVFAVAIRDTVIGKECMLTADETFAVSF